MIKSSMTRPWSAPVSAELAILVLTARTGGEDLMRILWPVLVSQLLAVMALATLMREEK